MPVRVPNWRPSNECLQTIAQCVYIYRLLLFVTYTYRRPNQHLIWTHTNKFLYVCLGSKKAVGAGIYDLFEDEDHLFGSFKFSIFANTTLSHIMISFKNGEIAFFTVMRISVGNRWDIITDFQIRKVILFLSVDLYVWNWQYTEAKTVISTSEKINIKTPVTIL